jgi:hypothetical protein
MEPTHGSINEISKFRMPLLVSSILAVLELVKARPGKAGDK